MRILIVEDNEAVVSILRITLERSLENIEIFTAESMDSALGMLGQDTDFDVVYMDNDLGSDCGAGAILLPKVLAKFEKAKVFWISGSQLPSQLQSKRVTEMIKPFLPSVVERNLSLV